MHRMTMRRSASLPKESMKLHLQDYCSSTSIHALKYVAEPRRPTVEKAWWLIILITCLVCNIILIRRMWIKYNEGPPEDYDVFDIPFPAITICNEIKIKKSIYDELKLTEEGEKKLQNLRLIERYSDMASSGEGLNLTNIFGTFRRPMKGKPSDVRKSSHSGVDEFNYNNSGLSDDHFTEEFNFLAEATPSLSEMMTKCVNVLLLGDPDCEQWFEQTITDHGMCFSTNEFDIACLLRWFEGECDGWMDWLPEKGEYRDRKDHLAYPYRALSNGRLFGLSIELKTNVSEIWEHRNNEENSGFKVMLHLPEDMPLMGEGPIHVPLDTEVVVMVKPVINSISEGLKAYKPKDRKCYTSIDEKWLSFFLVYTQKNCELECLTNYTYSMCNCVAVYMPRKRYMANCSPSARTCILNAEIFFTKKKKLLECECWPSCFSLEYKTSVQYGMFTSNSSRELSAEGFATSKLVVFFEDNKIPNHQRREIVDFVDFLANCGGLLGLFSGMSILSFCEIFYYLTLRLWNNIRLVREKVIFKPSDTIPSKDSHAEDSGDNRSVHTIS